MIHSISADKPSFKKVNFKPGLNVVLATRTQESDKRDSRNGLGKSTLVDILHFCLGGNRSGVLTNPILDGWTFKVTLDIGDRTYAVSRAVADSSHVFVDGDCGDWPIRPQPTLRENRFTNTQWTDALGYLMFSIDLGYKRKHHPTFRSLVSYFVRRDSSRGYHSPFQHDYRQLTGNIQVNTAYLLDLDWAIALRRQDLRDEETALRALKKETAAATVRDALGDEAELEAVRIRLIDEIAAEKNHLDNFRVLKTYRRLEADADRFTEEVHELLNQNVSDRKILELYKSSIVEEADADPEQIAQLYEEAGLLFPDVVTKRLSDVQQFHRNIVRNRRDFLSTEMAVLSEAIQKRERAMDELDNKKSDIMNVLKTHGALDEFTQIQQRHQTKVAELEDVVRRLKILGDIDSKKTALALESATLSQRMKLDLAERTIQRTEAIRAFNTYSERLYNKSGELLIGTSESGYTFGVKIERSASSGYEKMKILCYDLMLAKLWAHKRTSPGFLIHDSTIFADVDERQVAHALRLAADESGEHGYQYICMMNSDHIPGDDIDLGFDFDSRVAIKFTDATPDGGLLGIRF